MQILSDHPSDLRKMCSAAVANIAHLHMTKNQGNFTIGSYVRGKHLDKLSKVECSYIDFECFPAV